MFEEKNIHKLFSNIPFLQSPIFLKTLFSCQQQGTKKIAKIIENGRK